MGKAKPYEQLCRSWVGPSDEYDYLFEMPTGKYNETIGTAPGEKILCKEKYALDAYRAYIGDTRFILKSKDLPIYSIQEVRAVAFMSTDKLVKCNEVNSGIEVYVPLSEIKGDLRDAVMNGESFKVMIIKSKDGYNYASRKKCEHVIDISTLKEYLENGTDFDVKIETLVRGGFIAKFNGTVDCFLPGAHAAANVIYDFESYLGRTVRVCVDNFDQGSNMYIVSHKKYIKKIMPDRIQDIEYGQKYKGVLTSDPTKFGIFVEFEIDPAYGPIYTGLIKFGNDNSLKNMKQGDEIEFYVSNVSLNGRGCKINLVTNLDDVPAENLEWQAKKNATVGKKFDYICIDGKLTVMDSNENEIYSLLIDPSSYSNGELTKYKKVVVNEVDVINKNVSLSFAE